MLVKLLNGLAALLLALATAALALFFIGSQEAHNQMVEQYFWGTLGLRFSFASFIGLVGAVLWLGINKVLLIIGFTKETNLSKVTFLLVVSVIGGSLIGALAFCSL